LQLSDGGLPIHDPSDGVHAIPTGDGRETALGAAQKEIEEGPREVGEESERVGPDNGKPLGGDGFAVDGARFGDDQGGMGLRVVRAGMEY
jgi:hypothetical protein